MKAQIERILETEQEAKQRVAEAEKRARELATEGAEESERLLDRAREDAREEARASIQDAREQAGSARCAILDQARAEADGFVGSQSTIQSLAAAAARSIAGLE
jgi:vacuolar-type H+-ATPase subunit H